MRWTTFGEGESRYGANVVRGAMLLRGAALGGRTLRAHVDLAELLVTLHVWRSSSQPGISSLGGKNLERLRSLSNQGCDCCCCCCCNGGNCKS